MLAMLTPGCAGAVNGSDVNLPPMPVIVGAPRSGNTLLRFMIDAHPQMAIPPETGFLWLPFGDEADGPASRESFFRQITNYPPESPAWGDFGIAAESFHSVLQAIEPFDPAEGVRAFYRLYAQSQNKPRYGDKTPAHSQQIGSIARLLPEAHFLHIIRDGRDVALSLRERWFAPTREMAGLAAHWANVVRGTRQAAREVQARYREVRYEALVRDPSTVLRWICDFLRLEFDSCMLNYWEHTPERLAEHRTRLRPDGSILVSHEQRIDQQRLTMFPPQPSRIGRWRSEMTPGEHAEFLLQAGDLLCELGYGVELSGESGPV